MFGWFKKKGNTSPPWDPKYDCLARYNSECTWGILHDEETKAKMRILQLEYNKRMEDWWRDQNIG